MIIWRFSLRAVCNEIVLINCTVQHISIVPKSGVECEWNEAIL